MYKKHKGEVMGNEIVYKPKTQLALNVLFSIGNASNVVQEKTHSYMKSTGLTASQFAIIDILGHNGSMKISEIYNKMLIKSGNRTMILDSIEDKGFIKRVFSKNDRREILIELTASGQKFFNENYEAYGNFVERTLSPLLQGEQKELVAMLKKL